jgi:uncharacterized protein with NRDE domain
MRKTEEESLLDTVDTLEGILLLVGSREQWELWQHLDKAIRCKKDFQKVHNISDAELDEIWSGYRKFRPFLAYRYDSIKKVNASIRENPQKHASQMISERSEVAHAKT